jgi:hypothetical protein
MTFDMPNSGMRFSKKVGHGMVMLSNAMNLVLRLDHLCRDGTID